MKDFCERYGITERQFLGLDMIEDSLYLDHITEIPVGFNPTVSENLLLNSVTEIPSGFNPTVGRTLHLNSVKKIPIDFNPIVGWSLFLGGVTEIPTGFNPTVGWDLHLNKDIETPTYTKLPLNYFFSWQDGKYTKVDGVFTEVVSKESDNVWKVKTINSKQVKYIATDGEFYSLGKTSPVARENLIDKISNMNK